MADITINDFDLDDINTRRLEGSSPVILVIGSRGKGKSEIARQLLYALRSVPAGVVFSGTETSRPFYAENVPSLFVYSVFDKQALTKIVNEQKKAAQKKDILILIDDMMYEPGFLRNPLMKGIFLNGRHWKITLVLTTQYAIDVPCALRGNVDYVFLMRENNLQTVAKLHKNFGGLFPHHTLFHHALKHCTQNFGSLVIDNVRERVCKYRVNIETAPTKFKIFDPLVWKFAEKHTVCRSQELDILEEDTCRILVDK